MPIRRRMLDYRVVVRKVSTGSTPFGWEVRDIDALTPVHVSTERFRSMDAAYRSGQAWLADFSSKPLSGQKTVRSRRKPHEVVSDNAIDAADLRPEEPLPALTRPKLAADQLIGTADPVYPSQIG